MKPIAFILLLIFMPIYFLFAQSAKLAMQIDSLQNILIESGEEQKPSILLQLAQKEQTVSPISAHNHIKQLLEMGDSSSFLIEKIEALKLRAQLFTNAKQFDSALFCLGVAIVYQNQIEKEIQTKIQSQINSIHSEKVKKINYEDDGIGLSAAQQFAFAITLLVLLALAFTFFIYKRQLKKRLKTQSDELMRLKNQMEHRQSLLEENIKARTIDLEKELAQSRLKDLELKKALKRAEDANFLKNAFLANMSHEIRTPLNGIIGFSSLLETELSMIENQELYDYAIGIGQSGDRLLNLITNIIDISRIDANDIETEIHPCKVDEIVANICELHMFSANEKGLAFKTKLGNMPLVMADNAKLMRVTNIILDNAIKYTDSGFINITAEHIEQSKEVKIRFKDTGIGIDEAYKTHMFEAFRQESSGYDRQHQGAGLGLPLAKRLLDLMHGRIEIHSVRSGGTTVDIFIPCLDKHSTADLSTVRLQTIAPVIGSVDIFVVEDDRMNRKVLEKILKPAGSVTLAVDGVETLKIVGERFKKGHIFQVMLFDINLPSPWDGIKLMHQIRKDYSAYRNIPFIAQTAYAMAGDREKFIDAGFDDYIAKPINKNELITIIKNQLENFSGPTPR